MSIDFQKKKINLIIADDHVLVRKALVRTLESFDRIGQIRQAKNGLELTELCRSEIPDLALVDIEMPEMDGYTSSKIILEEHKAVKVIILSMHADNSKMERLFDLGVHGFLSKNIEIDELEKAIYSVIDKGFYYNEENGLTVRKLLDNKRQLLKPILSQREIEVLKLICQEVSYREISEKLFISEKTIHNHRNRIMEKIGAKSTIGIVKYAWCNRLLTWDIEQPE